MTRPSLTSDPILRVSIALLAAVVSLTALKFAQDIFAPMTLAIVAGVIFAPLADRIERLGLPRGAVAILLLVVLFLTAAALIFMAEPYLTAAIDQIPVVKYEIRKLMYEYRDLIRGIDDMNREMEAALGAQAQEEASNMPSLTDALMLAPVILAQLLIFMGAFFFFLLTRNEIYTWMSRNIGTRADTGVLLERFCNAERVVSRYFATISAINLGLGVAVGGGLMAIGLPGAVVWGIAAALLNFVLYLGPAALAAGLLLAGVVTYDGLMSFAPMALYLLLNMTEAQFVTPALIGKHIRVNPFLIFVALIFWLWLWGPLGGIVAIPVTMIFLTLFDIFDTSPASRPLPRAA